MRSMRGEAVLNLPAKKVWEMYRNNEIVSKIDPTMLAGAEYLEGDGSPGSLRVFKLGPALQSYGKVSVEKVESGRSVTYQVVGGELSNIYSPYRVTFAFIPVEGKEEEQCIAEWSAEFEPLSASTPLPDQAKDAALGYLRSFEKFQHCI